MVDVQLKTRYKVNPKLIMSFAEDEFVGIGIINQAESLSILPKHEAITGLYYFFNWNTIENALNYFPAENQELYTNLWQEFVKKDFLIDNEEFPSLSGNVMPMAGKEYPLYQEILETVVQPTLNVWINGKNLSHVAHKAFELGSAKVVYTSSAPEDKPAIQLDNPLMLDVPIENVSSICFSEKFNLYITNPPGPDIFSDKILEDLLYAKNNFLSPDCTFLPAKLEIKVFGFSSGSYKPFYDESFELDTLYNLDYSYYRDLLKDYTVGYYGDLINTQYDILTEITSLQEIIFQNLDTSVIECEAGLTAVKDGYLTNLCLFFETTYGDQMIFSNSPLQQNPSIIQRCYYFARPRTLKKGSKINIKFKYDGNTSLQFVSITE